MRRAALALTLTLLTVACGSIGDLGGLGDILGSPSPSQASDVRGTVTNVNTSNRSIELDVITVNNLRNSDSGRRGIIYYDNNTRVVFGGRDYNVSDLERGDEIVVRGANQNGRYVADTIEVVRDVSR